MVKYPVSQSSFREIRKGGFLYVDKTKYIHQLVSSGKYFFLSRPRRFGKSMLISTMDSYFRNERELFKGLAIDQLEPEEWIKYPVLRLDFTRGGYNNPEDLPRFLVKVVDEWEREYGMSHPDQTPDWRFDQLIRDIYEKTGRQVVILIDEYDSPIVDVHDKPELEALNRKTLHDFYRVMKASEDCLKFVFLTGVGKLGQINIFSGLNNLMDISLESKFSAICGITEQELKDNYREGIEELGRQYKWTYEEALLRLMDQYGGYHFSEDLVDVCNPCSIVRALYNSDIRDYWFQSGTPTSMVQQFIDNDWGTPDLEGAIVTVLDLDSGDMLGHDLVLACYFAGYLTIKGYRQNNETYTLGFPNKEVLNVFIKQLIQLARG